MTKTRIRRTNDSTTTKTSLKSAKVKKAVLLARINAQAEIHKIQSQQLIERTKFEKEELQRICLEKEQRLKQEQQREEQRSRREERRLIREEQEQKFQQQFSQAQLKAELSEAIAEISALETDDLMVSTRHLTNDNPITTVSTDVACSSSSLFRASEPVTVSLTLVVNASKPAEVICATTHCATLDNAMLPANKQTFSKIVTERAGVARSLLLHGPRPLTNPGEQADSYVEPNLQSPKSDILRNDNLAAKFDFLSEPYLETRDENEFSNLLGSRFSSPRE